MVKKIPLGTLATPAPPLFRASCWVRLFALLALLLGGSSAWAQTVNTYAATVSVGTYTPITGTLLSAATSSNSLDSYVGVIPASAIPFAFTYAGNNVSAGPINVSSNGFLTFGATTTSTTLYTPISSTTAFGGVVAPFARDLNARYSTTAGQNGEIRYSVEGTAPNRELVVQWSNFRPYVNSTTTDYLLWNFQVRLAETTNVVKIVYSPDTFVGAGQSGTAQVGLRGTANTDYKNFLINTANPWTAPAPGTSNASTASYSTTLQPAAGQTYTFTPPAPCVGTPTAGTASATAATICAGTTSELSLSGTTVGAGITYQWQSASSSTGPFVNISGATASSYTASPTQATYYQAVVTCANGGSPVSAISNVVALTVLAPTYATLPYTQDFESTWVSRCNTNDVPDANWANTPAAGNNSWRREDDGASAGWSSVTLGGYTPAGSNASGASSSHSARFHNRSASSGTIGALDLYLNLTGGTGTPTLKFDYRNSDSNTVDVLLSTDGGATFPTTLQTLGTQAAWTSYLISLPTTVTATTVVRFRATANFGSNDNGLDNVSVDYVSCAQPTALAATTTAAGTTASASITFAPAAGATSYTLSISPAVAGAPTTVSASPFTLTGLAYSTTYTLTLTTNCGSTTSQATTYTFTTLCAPPTYATLPYTQGFESSWLSRCGTSDAPDANWANNPVTGNNSWRRNDDGTSANWGSTSGAYTPGGSNVNGASSTYSARFHSYNAASAQVGNLDYYVNLSAAGSKRLVFDYINTSGTDKLSVLLSTDGGATFGTTALTQQVVSATWSRVTVDFASTSATSVLRFQATSDFGATDIGLDNVNVLLTPAFDVQPTALVAPAANTTLSCYSSTEAVTMTVRNAGTSALDFTATPLTVTVNVTGAVTQTLTATVNTNAANGGNPLAVGATANITLPTTLNMTTVGTYTLAVTATVAGDGNTANDVLGTQTRTVAAPVAGTLTPAATSLCVSGTATLTVTGAANGSIQFQSSPDGTTFTDIAGATSASYTTPVLTTTTYYRAQVRCNTGTATSNVSTITVNNPLVASTNTPVAACAGSPATLTATASAGSAVRFFTTATGGTALTSTTAGSYTTPALTTSTTYYAEAYSGGQESVGAAAYNSTGQSPQTGGALYFTATAPATIASVTVYLNAGQAAGTVTIALRTGSSTTGAIVNSQNVAFAVPAGPATGVASYVVPLNYQVPAAGAYTLHLSGATQGGLLRDSGGSNATGYPYTTASGNISITAPNTSTYYYYFYNWQISNECVNATRTPIQVNVAQPATATFSYPATGGNCAGSTGTVAATLASGATAGTFTSTTGLTINATTGAVNLATSTAGTYTVTNTVAASGACGAVTATATITVNPTPARPTLTPTYNGTTTTLTSSAATGNQFYFNGAAIPGAAGQTYVVNGSATTYGSYTVVVTNSFGCSSAASVATVVTTTRAGIAGASLLVYPNPTPTGQVTLELSGFRSATQLAVIDALGRVVRSEMLPATTGIVTHSLNLSGMASGVYMLRLTNADGIETRRLVRE